ncbi:gluconate transporter [Rhodococcus sp. RS1C4]|uniref:GntP family permease n=1 Tax=Nocardiaceae TaxID=85025 RepID=UPI0003668170|nr:MULTISPECIES: gluconate:H+ symporter [Rhodococcus]OZC53096.1 gluconate transporter [Rhodococcus sp. RS1C4]OZC79246.1 gluconate transporter [Rhodococcus sp. 06-418-1B]OZD15043.1 gluconate transporter [Rhodococcus sp. 06-156-4C]OZD19872.1 gluconate transporter [Rhodococcus sp. 06-156-4a]OZD22820.1 gluconate transporter [Rhodococcus sp. 06-156-3C]
MLTTLAQAADGATASDARLILSAIVGVAVIIGLITWLKLHPFVSLTIGAVGVGIAAELGAADSVAAFVEGFGSTMGSVGILIGFGAMFGKLLADSGGADRVVDTLVGKSSPALLPWTMALVGAVIGLPMFFEIGLVLLMPVIILVARRSGQPLIRIAIPTLAGLSAMHGLVPPHPGPLVAVSALDANLGLTLGLGVIVAIPTVVVAGPLFGKLASKWVDVPVPALFETSENEESRRRPTFAATLAAILLPVVLMLGKAAADVIAAESSSPLKGLLDFLGTPVVALGIAVLAGIFLLGRGGGMDRPAIAKSLESSLPPIAGILLIVGAGGGFKQVLIDTGIADVIADAIKSSSLPVLFLAWLVAVLIRVATGSATVATVTASGILAPVAAELSSTHVSLMVLAIGAGSLFLSHVNDAGFWLVKEYLGTSVVQNLKTWSVMECVISVTGLAGVLALSVVI